MSVSGVQIKVHKDMPGWVWGWTTWLSHSQITTWRVIVNQESFANRSVIIYSWNWMMQYLLQFLWTWQRCMEMDEKCADFKQGSSLQVKTTTECTIKRGALKPHSKGSIKKSSCIITTQENEKEDRIAILESQKEIDLVMPPKVTHMTHTVCAHTHKQICTRTI